MNAADLRRVSPFGRNDKARFLRLGVLAQYFLAAVVFVI
jgi:hypothetical protein